MGATGLSALIHLAAALEVDHGAETIALGRAAVDDADCVLETGGRHLAYRVALHGDGEVRTAAAFHTAGAPFALHYLPHRAMPCPAYAGPRLALSSQTAQNESPQKRA
jgi:hypothetical protein